MPPRIAIPLPTSHDEAYNRLNWQVYAEAIQASGGDPVRVPLTLSDAELKTLFDRTDGILLPGSPADVDPAVYGHEREEACAPADPQRERTDRFLLEHAFVNHKPVFGICFGMQMLNCYLGGTLVQDLAVLPVNHAAARGVNIAHSASIAQHSMLASIMDAAEITSKDNELRLSVNSSHHQAVGIPGHGLLVAARCPGDGVIEAVEAAPLPSEVGRRTWILGVQWHPERTFRTSATSRALFARFVIESARE